MSGLGEYSNFCPANDKGGYLKYRELLRDKVEILRNILVFQALVEVP